MEEINSEVANAESRTRFWKLVLGEANPRTGWFRIAATAKNTAGEPWNKEMKQLDASGRYFGFQLRKITK